MLGRGDSVTGETDLTKMLSTLSVSVRPGRFAVVSLSPELSVLPSLADGIEMVMAEEEGTTVICRVERAEAEGWPVRFVASWLTLDVHSSLEAVGLTAAFSAALAVDQISCNVLAGYYHDHILVPVDRTDDALACLERLRSTQVV